MDLRPNSFLMSTAVILAYWHGLLVTVHCTKTVGRLLRRIWRRHFAREILSIMKDSHIGTYGVLGLLFYFGLLWNLLSTLSLSLACMAVASGDAWSKFCSAQIINILPYARKEEESKAKVIYDG